MINRLRPFYRKIGNCRVCRDFKY